MCRCTWMTQGGRFALPGRGRGRSQLPAKNVSNLRFLASVPFNSNCEQNPMNGIEAICGSGIPFKGSPRVIGVRDKQTHGKAVVSQMVQSAR